MTGREDRSWPAYLLGGRIRTSTVALLVAFMGIWWVYDTYEPAPAPPVQVPAIDVVPPGFVPDPAYTWVPRTDVAPRTTTSTTPTTTETSPTTTETSPTSPTSPTTPTSPTASPTASPTEQGADPGATATTEEPERPAPTTGATPATPSP